MKALRIRVNKALEIFLVILMILLLGDVLLQVISRYLLGNTISFTDELAGFLLMWVGMAGAAYVTGRREHLAITVFRDKLKPSIQYYLDVLINLLILAFVLSVLIIGGSWLVYTRFYLEQTSASLEIPLGYVYLILPLSGMLILFYVIDDITRKIKKPAK